MLFCKVYNCYHTCHIMRTLTYFVASAIAVLQLAGSSASQKMNITIVNQLTTWRECSSENVTKEWLLCLSPSSDGNGMYFEYAYCPTKEFSPAPLLTGGPMTCIPCPNANSELNDCASAIQNISSFYNITGSSSDTEDSIRFCEQMCQSGTSGDECTQDAPCNPGYFCNIASTSNSGTCKQCPYNISTCFNTEFASSLSGQNECYNCQLACTDQLPGLSNSSVSMNGLYLQSNKPISNAIQSNYMTARGPLMDCSKLILSGVDTCVGAKDHVCMVEDFTSDVLFWDLSEKAERNGCVAILYFPSAGNSGQHSNDELKIPFIFVSEETEKQLLKSRIGKMVEVEVQVFGSACMPSWSVYGYGDLCSEKLPCKENEYCDIRKTVKDGVYIDGWCAKCPTTDQGEPDSAGCFFTRGAGSVVKGPEQVESCARSCKATNWFKDCKFCPQDITELDFGVENPEEQCHFCPNNDILYPHRLVPIFGENVTCNNLQAFFERIEVPRDSQNCKLAMKMNYICGCEGPGYAGANSDAKKAALVWLPRISAILSFMVSSLGAKRDDVILVADNPINSHLLICLKGSAFIIYDASKTVVKRSKIVNQVSLHLRHFCRNDIHPDLFVLLVTLLHFLAFDLSFNI